MNAPVFDSRQCNLGEGPLWHPERHQLFWFDIHAKKMLSRTDSGPQEWQFEEQVSAAGWVDRDTLLIASETQLFKFDLTTKEQTHLCPLEAENSVTRSNDGRADPLGGFWIGTMGQHAEQGAGAIYRYYKGTLKRLYDDISISNAICFCPITPHAYFTDTRTKQVMRVSLDPETGWPRGNPSVFLDLTQDDLNPDGAVTDHEGNLWVAEWGASRVSCYDATGTRLRSVNVGGSQSSCPAFGGQGLRDLYVTTARVGLGSAACDGDGQVFVVKDVAKGVAEPRVILS